MNTHLLAAKAAKKDEYYTRIKDIGAELTHYPDAFRGKVVYSNCDDWRKSQFVKYFHDHFHELGLKKYIATCYASKDVLTHGEALWYEYDGVEERHGALRGDGDFRSPECVAYLKQCDVVVTNPPFSLFREFVALIKKVLMKDFLVIGNLNAVKYKEVFPMIKAGEVGLGVKIPKTFIMPSGLTQKFGNLCWFVTLTHDHINPPLTLTATYTPEAYPRYDNYDAIEVGRMEDIPCDYYGVMGVPISFLDKWCPEQFEIVGVTSTWSGAASKTYGKQERIKKDGSTQIVTALNSGPSILLPTAPANEVYYTVDGKAYKLLYSRILIRRRK